jgi:hypothetical protein
MAGALPAQYFLSGLLEMTYDPPTITSMTTVPTRGGDLYISGTSFGPLGYVVRALFSVPTAQAARR